jgi:hypothetical protein
METVKIIAVLSEKAKQFYRAHPRKELVPTFIGLDGEKKLIEIATPFSSIESKYKAIEAVRIMFAEHGVTSYGFISEGWMVSGDDIGDEIRPEDHPRRIEVVNIIATDGTTQHHRIYEMRRDKKRVLYLDLKLDEPEATTESRFLDLLSPPATAKGAAGGPAAMILSLRSNG